MELKVEHDPEHDVWTIVHRNCDIQTSLDIQRWRSKLDDELRQLGGNKVFLLIDLEGFSISPSIMDEYGRNAKEVVGAHAIGAIRYGRGDARTRTEISLQAMANNFPANIFPSRESALQAVAHLRSRDTAKAG